MSKASSESVTVLVNETWIGGDELDDAAVDSDPNKPFEHGLSLVETNVEPQSPPALLSPLTRSRLQKTSSTPALSKTPRMSTSEIIQLANAPVTETAATDLLDRGLYAQSSARFSMLADADPESARLRRFNNVAAYLSNDYWGPIIPRMWTRFLRFGIGPDQETIPAILVREFAEAIAQDADTLYDAGRYDAALTALDVCASLVGHKPLPVLEGPQRLADFGAPCPDFQYDERFGARVQDLLGRAGVHRTYRTPARIAKIRDWAQHQDRARRRAGAETGDDVSGAVLALVDLGRLFDHGNTESHDLANLCFEEAFKVAQSPSDRTFIEKAIGRYKVDFAKTKGDLMESQKQVMQKFMSGVRALRQGQLQVASTDLTQALRLFPDSAACFTKALEARVSVEIASAANVIRRIGSMMTETAPIDARWCNKVAADLLDVTIAGGGSPRNQNQHQQAHGIEADKDVLGRARAALEAGELAQAASLYSQLGADGVADLDDIRTMMKAMALSEQAGSRLEAIQLLRQVQLRHPDLAMIQAMIDQQTRLYLCGRIYKLWRAQALEELRSPSHAAVGLVLLQQHAAQYAQQSALPELVADLNQLIYAGSLRAHAEQIFADATASEQAVIDARKSWAESAQTIGDSGVNIPGESDLSRRRLAGLGSVQEAVDAIGSALDRGRLRRAQRLITAIGAVDPAHPEIRRWSQALETARRNRDRARAEYVAASEARLDKDWAQAVQRLKTAQQLRPCAFYETQLQEAESMMAWQEEVQSGRARTQVQALVAADSWAEADALLDRIGQVRTDEVALERWRALVQIGLADQQKQQQQQQQQQPNEMSTSPRPRSNQISGNDAPAKP